MVSNTPKTLLTKMICTALILGLHLHTVHVRHDLNNSNPGIYAKCDQTTIGVYENSINHTTMYVGHTIPVGPVNVMLGVATGYGNLRPVLIPSIVINNLRIHAILPSGVGRKGGIHFSIEKAF